MASSITLSFSSLRTPQPRTAVIPATFSLPSPPATALRFPTTQKRKTAVVSAVGDVSADGNNYLIAGAIAIALIGTAFPILFSRKDLCPECDGAGFIRKSGVTLRANAARKDESQIVCARCNGLGKLSQIDKY